MCLCSIIDIPAIVAWCTKYKEVFQIAAWCGAVVTAIVAVFQIGLNLRQRKAEQRWKEALQAKTLLDELLKSPKASSALQMLDWDGRNYNDENGAIFVVRQAEFVSDLRTVNLVFNPKEVYVRDCFDALFSQLDMIEHFINIRLIRFEDVQGFFKYYVQLIEKKHWIFCGFISCFGYKGTFNFLSRFPEWCNDPGCKIESAPDA